MQETGVIHECPNCPDVYTVRDTCPYCRAEQTVRDAQDRLRQAHAADCERQQPESKPTGILFRGAVVTLWLAGLFVFGVGVVTIVGWLS